MSVENMDRIFYAVNFFLSIASYDWKHTKQFYAVRLFKAVLRRLFPVCQPSACLAAAE